MTLIDAYDAFLLFILFLVYFFRVVTWEKIKIKIKINSKKIKKIFQLLNIR